MQGAIDIMVESFAVDYMVDVNGRTRCMFEHTSHCRRGHRCKLETFHFASEVVGNVGHCLDSLYVGPGED